MDLALKLGAIFRSVEIEIMALPILGGGLSSDTIYISTLSRTKAKHYE